MTETRSEIFAWETAGFANSNPTIPRPLISCLMVTQAGRLEMFKHAVQDFLAQDYNPKELIIVSSSPEANLVEYRRFVESLEASNIQFHVMPRIKSQASLGAMRNETNRLAQGEYCCTWDDDDRYHPQRLWAHYLPIFRNQVDLSYMNQQLHFFTAARQLYWVDWADRRAPGILMYRKTFRTYPETGQSAARGEDTSFLRVLVNELGYQVCKADGDATLYLRNYHGENTWGLSHHLALARRSVIDHDRLLQNRQRLETAIQYFKLRSPVYVFSKAGFEFTL